MGQRIQYLRFATARRHPDSERHEGLFCIAYELVRSGRLEAHEAAQLEELIGWFERHVRVPRCFSRRTPEDERPRRAICWFKPHARRPIAKMWRLARLLRELRVPVQVILTHRPGYVTYEDDHQVAAEPVADTNLEGEWRA
jgi:hypothetical protein